MFDPAPMTVFPTHPSVNGPRLLELANAVESHRWGFNMLGWVTSASLQSSYRNQYPDARDQFWQDVDEPNFCGTVCCIGGTGQLLFFDQPLGEDDFVEDELFDLLGLTEEQGDALFYEFPVCPTPTRTQAVKVIRHLARTGVVDWSIIR
jgi:hypothetical protein